LQTDQIGLAFIVAHRRVGPGGSRTDLTRSNRLERRVGALDWATTACGSIHQDLTLVADLLLYVVIVLFSMAEK